VKTYHQAGNYDVRLQAMTADNRLAVEIKREFITVTGSAPLLSVSRVGRRSCLPGSRMTAPTSSNPRWTCRGSLGPGGTGFDGGSVRFTPCAFRPRASGISGCTSLESGLKVLLLSRR